MKHILIVDDDIHIGNMVDEALVKEGNKIFSFRDLYVGLSKVKDLLRIDML